MDETTFVYCIATVSPCGAFTGPVKIGVSSTPAKRVSSLQTGSAKTLGVAGVIIVHNRRLANLVESGAHEAFKAKRLQGEWFDIGPGKALEFLADYMDETIHYCVAHDKVPAADYRQTLWDTGVTAIREKLAAERYLSAWEGEAAA